MLITIAILIVLAALLVIFFTRPARTVKRLEKLRSQPGPTTAYMKNMPDVEKIFGWADDLVQMGARRPGTPAGMQAQKYVKAKLESFGLDSVEILPSKSVLWSCRSHSLTVDGKSIPSYYMTDTLNNGTFGTFRTDQRCNNTEIIYVGDGKPADFKNVDVKGKIVMSEVKFTEIKYSMTKPFSTLFYDPDKTFEPGESLVNPYSANTFPYNYYNAMKNGAAGFVGILTDYIDSNEFNNENYAYMGGNMALPGLWVTRKDGELIKSMLKKGICNASMEMTVDIRQVDAGAVIGILKGKSDETIMVQSHYDSSTPGGAEDASGTAVVLALADFYSKLSKGRRSRTLMFVLMDTHFGDYESHEEFIAKYLGSDTNILADVCIEHLAEKVKEKHGKIVKTGECEPRMIFVSKVPALSKITREEVVRHGFRRTLVLSTAIIKDPPTDAYMYYKAGLPCICHISGPIYLYDNMDTSDKISKDQLRPTAETFADIIWRLTKLPRGEFK